MACARHEGSHELRQVILGAFGHYHDEMDWLPMLVLSLFGIERNEVPTPPLRSPPAWAR